MKKLSLHLFLIAFTAIMMTSCSKKMTPLTSTMFSADPSPLELVGSKVPVTINGRFPAKWFEKNTTVTITSVLKYQGGETAGDSEIFQGEKVAGNGKVINFNEGGALTIRTSFNYIPEMKKSELCLRFKISQKGKELKGFPDIKIADGVLSSAALASALTSTPAIAPDAFQRIIKDAYDADIMFLIQRAELRSSELNSENIKAWQDLVKEANENERKNLNIEISAYASPDGGLELNEKLAEKREGNTNEYLKKEFKKNNVDAEINAKYTAQDWEGFKKLIEASNLQDKDIMLRVLSMYPDPETREREIKNISSVYSEVTETILPRLRRSRLIANIETVGKTDDELKKATNSNLSSLSVEELLYASNLDGVSKEKVFTHITEKYPTDARGWNNLGTVYFQKRDVAKAEDAFNKASRTGSKSPEANMNLALLALDNNNTSKAEQLLGNAAGANSINETLGLLYLKEGNYSKAVQSFGDTKSNNAALAQILTKNYSKAKQILDAVKSKDATTYYLAAIVAARTNNASGVAGNLKSALDNGYKVNDVMNDLEFAKFLSNPDIQNMLSK